MYIKDYRKNFYTKEGKRINIKGYVYDNKSDKVIVLYKYNGFDTSKETDKKDFEKFLLNQKEYERKAFINSRYINNIYHFTNIDNLESILEKGILSKNKLLEGHISFSETDQYRYDNKLDYINTSISYFNYKMLYELTCTNNKYILMEINNKPLLKNDTLFSNKNAASNDAIIDDDIKKLFRGYRCYQDRYGKTNMLPINYPTNPSSEALIKDEIEVNNIKGIVYLSSMDNNDKDKVKSLTNNVHVNSLMMNAFPPRCDYMRWK